MNVLQRVSLSLGLAVFAGVAMAQAAARPASDAKTRVAVEAAFTKADTNADGKLSKDEAAKLPAIAARFDALDQDKDGTLSLVEFSAGYTPDAEPPVPSPSPLPSPPR